MLSKFHSEKKRKKEERLRKTKKVQHSRVYAHDRYGAHFAVFFRIATRFFWPNKLCMR